jgi:transposase
VLSYQGRHQGERDDLSESPKTFIWNGSKHRRPCAALRPRTTRAARQAELHAGGHPRAVHQVKIPSTPADIKTALAGAPACRRVVFETGRMAPMLHHGLTGCGVPVICIESRQARQALKSFATHKTDRNDARGLAHLARTGFFKPVHVKSLPAHAIRSLIIARKKLVGQRVTLENQIRGLAVVFGVRLPRVLSPAFIAKALQASEGIDGLSAAMRGLVAARAAVLSAIAAIDADMKKLARASDACRRLMTIPGVGHLTALAFAAAVDDPERFRRSRDLGAYPGLVPRRYQSGEVDYTGSISKCGDRRMRTLLYEAANVILTRYTQPLKLKDWGVGHRQAVHPPESADRARPAARHHHARHAPARHGV